MKGNELLVDRLQQMENIDEIQINTISFGLYEFSRDTGIIDVDRLSSRTCTLSNPSESLELNISMDDLFLGDK
jgi:hypothetical protein